jgi:hypothetical protein
MQKCKLCGLLLNGQGESFNRFPIAGVDNEHGVHNCCAAASYAARNMPILVAIVEHGPGPQQSPLGAYNKPPSVN